MSVLPVVSAVLFHTVISAPLALMISARFIEPRLHGLSKAVLRLMVFVTVCVVFALRDHAVATT